MDEDNKWLRRRIWRFFGRIWGGVVLVWLLCYWYSESTKKPISRVKPPEEVWSGYDASRPVTDIASFDYENMRVIYRTPESAVPKVKTYKPQQHGVVITTAEGRAVDTGLSYEDLYEQLDLDPLSPAFEELYELYMD